MDTVKQQTGSVKSKICSVNAKCVAAKIYGLCIGFQNSNLSSQTSMNEI